jgi:prophage regulatory protein
MTSAAPPKFLRLPVVLDRVGLGRDTLYRKVRRGEFPKPHRISERASAWLESEVSAWIQSRASGNQPTTGAAA